ncbi:MAG: hypothetical protein IJ833_01795 [Lachnospiraceae bacterium]|nr:hypothetical protein [Lachnospiraceae bacterium]
MKRLKRDILIMLLIVLTEIAALAGYWHVACDNTDLIRNKRIWSTLLGAATERIELNHSNPVIRQYFVNQHEQLNEVIVCFYHCDIAASGKVFVRISDAEGNVFYDYSFEPQYMKNDYFCLTAHPKQDIVWEVGKQYVIEISQENMVEDDYILVGTTRNASKPSVFMELPDGSTLFTSLDYTYQQTREVRERLVVLVKICLLADGVLFLVWLFSVKRKKEAWVIGAAAATGLLLYWGICTYRDAHLWYKQNTYVVHAMGKIGENSYTNSYEAFEASYEGGHKVFEVDFCMTSDGEIVLWHDWASPHGLPAYENGEAPTLQEFKEAKIYGTYTTLDMDDLLALMLEHPDIYIVTDSKSGDYHDAIEQFTLIREKLSGYSKEEQRRLQKHFIVQIYNDDMYEGVSSVMDFDNYIYTLYQRGTDRLDELGEFCVEHDIPVVVLPFNWWSEELQCTLHGYGLEVWIHTLNEPEDITYYRDRGIDGVYTDRTNLEELVKF